MDIEIEGFIMTSQALVVLLGIVAIVLILLFDKMRSGFTLLSSAIIFMVFGIITPSELLEGFSNKEMITVAMLFLVGEGVRQSGALSYIIRYLLPNRRGRVGALLFRILPFVTSISMVLNNTAVVIIFAPIIKRWAEKIGMPATKFLIPLSYATIFGGLCTLIGTSTNMLVNGMMLDAGYRGFSMFEIGRVGGVIAVVGIAYLVFFSNLLLPGYRERSDEDMDEALRNDDNIVEVMLTSRFSGIGKRLSQFNFYRHYGATIRTIKRNGERVKGNYKNHVLSEGDTLQLITDKSFVETWRDSSAFYIISYTADEEEEEDPFTARRNRWFGLSLLLIMMVGATVSEQIVEFTGGVRFDMFVMASLVMVIMAVAKLFPPKRYTKFITWDILIAIAAAFAISRAMSNSGINAMIAEWIIGVGDSFGLYGVLAMLYLVTMLLTELITNNAAVAIAFPVAVALGKQLGVDPMPFFVAISIAASASFSSPIGYQTNLIVQGMGGYKFRDYLRIGVCLNIITFVISLILIPRIWSF